MVYLESMKVHRVIELKKCVFDWFDEACRKVGETPSEAIENMITLFMSFDALCCVESDPKRSEELTTCLIMSKKE